jgi:mannose-6-phosphate isomerase-like protein (cupin superfamily)
MIGMKFRRDDSQFQRRAFQTWTKCFSPVISPSQLIKSSYVSRHSLSCKRSLDTNIRALPPEKSSPGEKSRHLRLKFRLDMETCAQIQSVTAPAEFVVEEHRSVSQPPQSVPQVEVPSGSVCSVVLSDDDIAAQPLESFPDGLVSWKTLFTASRTPTNSLSTGIALCSPHTGHLCAHRHAQAEVYYIIEGQGVVQIDNKQSRVQAGSVVFIPGDAEHAIWNAGEGPLRWFYVFPTDSFEDVIYRFS